MKKYIVFGYRNHSNMNPSEEPSKEERNIIMNKWRLWMEEMGDLLISIGSPLINGKAIDSTGILDKEVSNLSGYMMIKAENEIHAVELLNLSPLFGKGHGQDYEIFECIM